MADAFIFLIYALIATLVGALIVVWIRIVNTDINKEDE